MALRYAPQFDYDPQSDEALAAAQQPLPAPPPMAYAPSAADLPSVDDGLSTVPTQEDYQRALIDAGEQANAQIGVAAAEAGVVNDEIAEAQALAEQARAARRAAGLADGELSADEMAAMRQSEGAQLFGEARRRAGERVRVTSPNVAYGPTKRYTDTMGPLLTEQRNAAMATQSAELDAARLNTSLLQQEAEQQARIDQQMRASEIARQQRMEAQRMAVDKAYKAVQKADLEFQSADPIDPDKGWDDKGVGAKIAAVIAAGLLGFAGMDPFVHIRAITEDSLNAQRGNLDRLRARADSARNVQGASENLLGALRGQLGDEATADEAFRLWGYQNIRAQALAKLADAGVNIQAAQSHEFIVRLNQEIAEAQRKLELVAATNVPTITRVVDPRTLGQRQLDQALGKAGIDMMTKGGDQAIDVAARRQEQARGTIADLRKAEIDARAKAGDEARKELRGPHGVYQESAQFTERAAPGYAVVNQIDSLLDKYPEGTDFPGVDFIGGKQMFSWGEDAAVKQALDLIQEDMSRFRSGGAITEDEEARFAAQLYDGVRLGGDKRLRQNLAAIRKSLGAKLEVLERGISPEAREYVMRNGLLEGFTALPGNARVNKPDAAPSFVEDTE